MENIPESPTTARDIFLSNVRDAQQPLASGVAPAREARKLGVFPETFWRLQAPATAREISSWITSQQPECNISNHCHHERLSPASWSSGLPASLCLDAAIRGATGPEVSKNERK
jgi:hypothetical protein